MRHTIYFYHSRSKRWFYLIFFSLIGLFFASIALFEWTHADFFLLASAGFPMMWFGWFFIGPLITNELYSDEELVIKNQREQEVYSNEENDSQV